MPLSADGTNTQIVDEHGTPVQNEWELEETDEDLYFTSRGKPLPAVKIDSSYAGSIVNSLDQHVSPGINNALVLKAINVGLIPNGSIILVEFPDGSKATFVKQCTCTDMWIWTGQAWDSDGKPIRRDGTRKTASVPSGASSGGFVNANTVASSIALVAANSCQVVTTINDFSGGFTYTLWRLIPC